MQTEGLPQPEVSKVEKKKKAVTKFDVEPAVDMVNQRQVKRTSQTKKPTAELEITPPKKTRKVKAAVESTGAKTQKASAKKKSLPILQTGEAIKVPTEVNNLDVTNAPHETEPISVSTIEKIEAVIGSTPGDELPKKAIVKKPKAVRKQKVLPGNQGEAAVKSESVTVTFQLRFTSQYGQTIYIVGNHPLLGNNEIATALPMQYFNHEFWYATIELPIVKIGNEIITYSYFIKSQDGTTLMEWASDKQIQASKINKSELLIIDSWNYAGYYENTFYTEPFKKVLLRSNYNEAAAEAVENFTHTFKVKAPLLTKDQVVCLSGSADDLGEWDASKILLLHRSENDNWYSVNVDLSQATFPIAYKYGVYNVSNKLLVTLEDGNNRVVFDVASEKKQTILADGFINLPNNTYKGAGVSIPVFSLRSLNGLGVGEFNDLKLLVDWAKKIGLKLIQILPVNDTTATNTSADSYPYAAISAFALHPLYLNLPTIVTNENQHLLPSLNEIKINLNNEEAVDYVEVVKAKWKFLKTLFPLQKEATFASEEFNAFFATNAHWLVPYAAFSYLRDEYETADFTQWPAYNSFDVFEINNLATPVLTTKDEISIHYFVQYHLHLQLKSATTYAHANGVILKGDIPIGIFRNSSDAWQQPALYNMDMQAGAPPDDFAIKGQNWGFPTYNWQRMAEDNFTWWKNRFAQMSYYFDAFRIDHILGFFRIWSIPMNAVEGIMGHFVPSVPVHINEFNEKQIWFDHYRYTKPYIVDSVIEEIFGDDAEYVRSTFLEKKLFENYDLRPEYDTQRKVEMYFASLDVSGTNLKIKQGLFDLISNVILFDVEGSQGQEYHFRIAVENTSSFRHLEYGTQQQLRELYINYFYRRQDEFWRREALQKLPELKRSTNMLICGEDLGMVPDCVPGVMKDLAILSLEIQRMPKDPSTEFFHPANAPYLSVVTPSTHDMSTIRGWWEEDREKTQRFFNNELGQQGMAPYFCEGWINKAIVLQHLYSPAMWSIFQMQDLLGTSETLRRENPADERINIPADPKHYWKYRMHLNVEDLLTETDFTNELAEYIKRSGR